MKLWVLLLALVAMLAGCGNPSATAPALTGTLNFASSERLHEHWLKHRGEFEAGLTERGYLTKARTFFANKSSDKELKSRPNGDQLHYLGPSNEFGVLAADNVIRTYFRPSSGHRYWERQ